MTSLPQLFAGTIYERSPSQIQENVLYAVQGELMRRGFFRGVIDGRLGSGHVGCHSTIATGRRVADERQA